MCVAYECLLRFFFPVLVGVGFFLCSSRHDGALSFVLSWSAFSLGDLFWLLPRCFARCGVGRGVTRRAWCVVAGGGTAGVLIMVALCSERVA